MTEANKDEAEKCKRVAQAALAAGDAQKAIRFLEKARRMCPDDRSIEALLAEAASGPSNAAGASRSGSGAREVPEGMRHRAAQVPSSVPSGGPKSVGKDGSSYTSEQMQLVQRILRTKDYYDVLSIPRDSDEEAVKRAYKKLALKLHPDKNKAPGAEEAFKKLSKAVQCLTDADKKQVYDMYGDEERIPKQHRQRFHQQEMTPDDIFAAFFGGGTMFHHHHHGRHDQGNDGHGGQAQHSQLPQMLPIIILILLALASNLAPSRDGGSRFSFTPSGQYRNERSTAALNVNYYVADEFDDHYPEGTRDLAEFEQQVDIYYVRALDSECLKQEKLMYTKVMRARRTGDAEELQKARDFPRTTCKEIERIKSDHPGIYERAKFMGGF